MKIRTAIRVTRLPWSLFMLLPALAVGATTMFFGLYNGLTQHPTHSFGLVVIPWWFGIQLNRFTLGFLHRPSALTLPRLTRTVLVLHGTIALFTALCFAILATLAGAKIPLPVAALLALFAICLPILSTKPFEWAGSKTINLLVVADVLLFAYIEDSWAPFLGRHPLTGGLLLLCGIAALYRRLLSRSNLRDRATTRDLAALNPGERQQEIQRLRDLKRGRRTSPWTRRSSAAPTSLPLHALVFEHLRGRGRLFFLSAFSAALTTVLIVAGFVVLYNRPADRGVSWSALRETLTSFIWGQPGDFAPAFFGSTLLVLFTALSAQFFPQLVRPTHYPFSRRQITRAVLRFNTDYTLRWHLAFATVVLFLAFLIRPIDSTAAHLPSLPPAIAGITVSLLVSWLLLASRALTVDWTHMMARLLLLASTGALMLIPAVATVWHAWLLSPAGLFTLLLGNGFAWIAYAFVLRRYYRVHDLVIHQVGMDYQTN